MNDYGMVLRRSDCSIVALSEKHGRIEYTGEKRPSVGELLRIAPNHACVISNMVEYDHFVRGEHYVRADLVPARGRIT